MRGAAGLRAVLCMATPLAVLLAAGCAAARSPQPPVSAWRVEGSPAVVSPAGIAVSASPVSAAPAAGAQTSAVSSVGRPLRTPLDEGRVRCPECGKTYQIR